MQMTVNHSSMIAATLNAAVDVDGCVTANRYSYTTGPIVKVKVWAVSNCSKCGAEMLGANWPVEVQWDIALDRNHVILSSVLEAWTNADVGQLTRMPWDIDPEDICMEAPEDLCAGCFEE